MKIKTVAAICKKNKTAFLLKEEEDFGQQFISDGRTIYPLSGLPELDSESLLTIFDIPEKGKSDWTVNRLPIAALPLKDVTWGEKQAEDMPITVRWNGKNLLPVKTPGGVYMIDTKYLSPISDVTPIELYERKSGDGVTYIAAKSGLLLQALILPENAVSDELIEVLDELLQLCLHKRNREKWEEVNRREEEEQLGFSIDPETGEVAE